MPSQKLNAKDSCAVEMGLLLQKKSNEKKNPPSEPEKVSSSDPVVNDRPQIGAENDPLDEITTAPIIEANETPVWVPIKN